MLSLSVLMFPIYLNFCLCNRIAHAITAALNTKIRYHKFSRQKPLSNIRQYPQKAEKYIL